MTVRVTTLANGLRVATDEMPMVETASLGAWIESGARDEQPSVNGISHLLEHMVFKGTRRRSARQIAEEIEAVGGHINAYTSREHTAYYAKVLKEDVPLAIDMIADIIQNPTMDAEELEREKSVICQEIHQANDTPDDIVFDHFQETAFPEQSMGRSVLGTEPIIRGFERDQVQGYRQDAYTAPVTVFAAAGRVDHDRVVAMVEDAFGGLAGAARPERPSAQYVGGEMRVERDLEQVHVVLGLEGLGYRDKDFYAASVLSTLFGGGMSSRLFQEIREDRGLAYSIYSFLACYEDGGLFGIYAGTGAEEVEELTPLIAGEAAKVIADVGEEETARARAQLKASILMGLESTSSRAEQLARQLLVFNRHLPVDEVVAQIDAVDVAAVKRVAERIFKGRPAVAAIGPMRRLESYESLAARFG